MTPQRVFRRKIGYLAAIAGLLVPLAWIGQPAPRGEPAAPGEDEARRLVAPLAQLRSDYGFSQAQLGEIDATSETVKLVTLGMRGVAATILWQQANDYFKRKDWSNLTAILKQLTRVQPHFVHVWRFQAWNLSYNCSHEFDAVRERYRYVIKGIDFLREGIHHNQHELKLVTDVGWYLSNKLGKADEHKEYRVFFKEDERFHQSLIDDPPPGVAIRERDNWLVGKRWFEAAESMVARGDSLGKVTPALFYSEAPMCQMSYAEAMNKEGAFDAAQAGWEQADADWTVLGRREIPGLEGEPPMRLGAVEILNDEAEALREKLDALVPGGRAGLRRKRLAELSDAQWTALLTHPQKRTPAQFTLAGEALEAIAVSDGQVAEVAPLAKKSLARRLARQIEEKSKAAARIKSSRDVVNYEYWRLRPKVEKTADCRAARTAIFEGERQRRAARYEEALQRYEAGLLAWRRVLDKSIADYLDDFKPAARRRKNDPNNKPLAAEDNFARDVSEIVQEYKILSDAERKGGDDKQPDRAAEILKKFEDVLKAHPPMP